MVGARGVVSGASPEENSVHSKPARAPGVMRITQVIIASYRLLAYVLCSGVLLSDLLSPLFGLPTPSTPPRCILEK